MGRGRAPGAWRLVLGAWGAGPGIESVHISSLRAAIHIFCKVTFSIRAFFMISAHVPKNNLLERTQIRLVADSMVFGQ